MRDRKELIEILEHCIKDGCSGCPNHYSDGNAACDDYMHGRIACIPVVMGQNAISLLKEQQETISSFQGTICKLNAALEEQAEIVRCGECIYHHYENNRIPYCELIDYGYGWKDNDFCSRGKRR